MGTIPCLTAMLPEFIHGGWTFCDTSQHTPLFWAGKTSGAAGLVQLHLATTFAEICKADNETLVDDLE